MSTRLYKFESTKTDATVREMYLHDDLTTLESITEPDIIVITELNELYKIINLLSAYMTKYSLDEIDFSRI